MGRLAKTIPLPDALKFQTLVLTRENKEVALTMSDANGAFMFKAPLTNDTYWISLDSKKYRLNESLTINQYKTENLQLTAHRVNP
jgi:hypothetical protein